MNPGQKTFRPKPPDKGSFPLDHEGECKEFMVKYMRCLKNHSNDNSLCRDESKSYLQCRMERNLMAKEEFSKLGYKDEVTEQ
ncbi:cytochrome c oxidase assembly protein COX19-like [Halichondria panicea]|uniref:cytochrome c oxidase assembly protein COX19-like n=1 Tax=Halichondria panicea TaxID=6063 RepID=UPI00312B471D